MANLVNNEGLYLFDGVKAVPINDLPESAWTHYSRSGRDDSDEETELLYKAVPWLNRGVDLRANAVASLPFIITKGGEQVDSSEEYENATGLLSDPESLFYLIEAALVLLGYSYLLIEGDGLEAEARYLHPFSITPDIDERLGLVGFTRTVGGWKKEYSPEQIVRFWAPDPLVEVGPATNSPGQAALLAAGVLRSVDEFARLFFKRGAIKAMLLAVSASTSESERDRVKKWWQKLFQGISNAWQTEIVNADAVTPVKIGEGVKELESTELVKNKREDISTALGIPHTLLFSEAANFATAQEDRLSFYRETIIPRARFIERVLNLQLLGEFGYKLRFKPETLDVFQVDEAERAQAFSLYTHSGLKRSYVAWMLHLPLMVGQEYEDLDEIDESRIPTMLEPYANPDREEEDGFRGAERGVKDEVTGAVKAALEEATKNDLKRWQRKALAKGPGVPFESAFIPEDVKERIREKLGEADTAEQVKQAFTDELRVIPVGANDPLLPVPANIGFSQAEIDSANARWDRLMPQHRGMLDTEEVEGQTDFDGEHW